MNRVYFIAEIGINHNGSLAKALELIKVAKEAGADVVKFQKREPRVCVPKNKWNDIRKTPEGKMSYIEYKERMEFGVKEYEVIDDFCRRIGIDWTASVWDLPSLRIIQQFNVPFIKIPSALLTDIALLKASADTGKEIVLSIGMSTESEVEKAIEVLSQTTDKITLLHCNSSYPSNEKELDILYIPVLKSKFPKYRIGYSGHEQGLLPSIVAASIGAEVIERHITLDKTDWGTDHAASLEPHELKELISEIRRVEDILGEPSLTLYQSELDARNKLKPDYNA